MRRTVFDGQTGLIFAIVLSSFFVNLLVLVAPLYMLQLFSRVISSGSLSTLAVITLGACVALVFYFFFDALRQKLVSRLGNRLEANLGSVVMSVLVQAASATDRRGAQPILDLQEIRRFVVGPSFIALLDVPWAILFVGIIFLFHPVLGAVALVGILGLALLGVISEIIIRKPEQAAAEANKVANATADEMLRNADVVRAMGTTTALTHRWQGFSYDSMRSSTRAVDRIAIMTSLARTLRLMLQIAMLGTAVMLVIEGTATPGVMIAASILLGRAAAPVEQSIGASRALMGVRAAIGRLNDLLGAIEEAGDIMELPEPAGRLSVENATVVIPNRQDALIFDVTFSVEPGDTVGLIGPSGAGKTTLARALSGLQPLSRGFIRIDDAALTDWPAEQIGRHIGYLPQRVELFDGTIAENIAMMNPDAAPSKIVEAAKLAEVHDLILALPGGYNAPVGLRGELLSAGQRQRIGLARALFGDRRLVILDEPNANLDPDGEAALSRAVQNMSAKGAVVIVISHRPSILNQMSHVAMMQGGRLVKFGKAREVINANVQRMNGSDAKPNDKVTILRPEDLIDRRKPTRPGTGQSAGMGGKPFSSNGESRI